MRYTFIIKVQVTIKQYINMIIMNYFWMLTGEELLEHLNSHGRILRKINSIKFFEYVKRILPEITIILIPEELFLYY